MRRDKLPRDSNSAGVELRGVTAGYGKTVVLENIHLTLDPGSSVSVIGRNGVGKTTLLSTIMGHTTLHAGEILIGGEHIEQRAIYQRALTGIGFVPQEREIFPSLTVEENMRIAARPGEWNEERIFDLFPNLAERRRNLGNQLSGGEQQMLAIARALLTNPAVLLMDEPTEGLAPVIVDALVEIMQRLQAAGSLTIMLVEQNSRVAFDFSARTIVLDRGAIAYDGPSAGLRNDPERLSQLIGVAS
ncbi:MAG: ABC transporter ATP-binding protein [Hyphomicrobiales bacterium]|nr:ABC transporter ATP-binding protein [Hyphomicrobiales bacterium]